MCRNWVTCDYSVPVCPSYCTFHISEIPPFKEFLVYPEDGFKSKADYIEKISSPPDWGIVFDSPPPGSDQPPPEDQSSTYSLLTEFERLKCSNVERKLDDTQLEAVELAFENKLTLIQVCMHGAGNYFLYITRRERIYHQFGWTL